MEIGMFDNEVCKGYVVKALMQMGKSRDEIKDVLNNVSWAFSELTEQEAKQLYWDY